MQTQAIGYAIEKDTITFDKENLLKYVTPQDLKSYGLIPELIGRLPVLTHLNPLDQTTLRSILTEPKNSLIKQYEKLFEYENIALTFDADVLDFVVEKAMTYKLGARGLRSILEAIMIDAMFEMPSEKNIKELHINLNYALEKFNKSEITKMKVA